MFIEKELPVVIDNVIDTDRTFNAISGREHKFRNLKMNWKIEELKNWIGKFRT